MSWHGLSDLRVAWPCQRADWAAELWEVMAHTVGQRVELGGLSKAEFNGRRGTVLGAIVVQSVQPKQSAMQFVLAGLPCGSLRGVI